MQFSLLIKHLVIKESIIAMVELEEVCAPFFFYFFFFFTFFLSINIVKLKLVIIKLLELKKIEVAIEMIIII